MDQSFSSAFTKSSVSTSSGLVFHRHRLITNLAHRDLFPTSSSRVIFFHPFPSTIQIFKQSKGTLMRKLNPLPISEYPSSRLFFSDSCFLDQTRSISSFTLSHSFVTLSMLFKLLTFPHPLHLKLF